MNCTGTLIGNDLTFTCTQAAVLSALNEATQLFVFAFAISIGLNLLLGIWKR